MAAAINLTAYSDALVVLGTAGVVVPLVRTLGVSPVLAYLAAGMILGPYGLGALVSAVPALYWITITEAKNVDGIAELGVVFMLFLIGLELSFERLKTMRRLVFGLGVMQVLTATTIIAGIASTMNFKPAVAVLIGACLALSSTAIVIDLLSAQGRMATSTGRTSFSVLLAQDLAVVPILMFIATLGADTEGTLLTIISTAVFKAALALLAIVGLGRLALRPLFRLVAGTQSTELFIAATLFVIVATGVVAAVAGLSMALGAFVAGLLLAETEYRKAIEATIEPFKGLLLGVFFFTVGMHIDMRLILRDPLSIILGVATLIALKTALLTGLARLYRLSWPTAIETGLLLGPSGEFALVGIGLASTLKIMTDADAAKITAITALSMATIPALAMLARNISRRIAPPKTPITLAANAPVPSDGHTIIIGHGRVGQVVSAMFEGHNCQKLIIDGDPKTVTEQRNQGRTIHFGNAADPEFLKACGLMTARAVVITIHTQKAIDVIVDIVRTLRPDIPIVARAKDSNHARHLYAKGATDAVPETIEASLQLSEAALLAIGIAAGPVIASIHEKRDEFRAELQQAVGDRDEPPRAIRAKLSTRRPT
ncbi:MAG: cation:proton antiporter [Hyphomicrobiaceae bacterium]